MRRACRFLLRARRVEVHLMRELLRLAIRQLAGRIRQEVAQPVEDLLRPGGHTAPASRRIKIERCALMGVFPVAQIHGFVEIQAQVVRQRGSGKRRHGGRDQVQSRRWGRFTASGCSRLVGRPLLQSH